ncbi:TIGR01777 family oxidoreductase [Leucobacter luti]|uniref:TIGR01777 family oxidoreductase n=1 Tax=Leucobacter luti TaxID=340320 RepID=UPI003CFD1ECF
MLRVIVSGASGLIGQELARSLRSDGHEVIELVRRAPRNASEVEWRPGEAALDPDQLRGADAVVNLNGASIGRLPWTKGYRRTLRSSRIAPTRTLADALAALGDEAPHFLSASAVGFYGSRPAELLTEEASPGTTFLARLCVEWERVAATAGPAARVTHLRTAPLLHRSATLKPMILLTKLGLGGPLGSGRQYWPWISLTDEVRAIRHLIERGISGPVNLCGPSRATAGSIGRELASQLHRPFLVPAPAPALRLALGRDAADSLLLADAQVAANALATSDFEFEHPTVSEAIASGLASGLT